MKPVCPVMSMFISIDISSSLYSVYSYFKVHWIEIFCLASILSSSLMEATFLKEKSVLLISPEFFGYETAVRDKLIEMGANVTLFDDRPNNGLVARSLIRINKKLFESKILEYYAKIAEDIADREFDIIFLLNPEALPVSFLEMCKVRWSKALYVMYMWDSINNRKHTLEFVPFCDRVFTFDRDDAKLPNFQFKPLFYLDLYSSIREKSQPIEYDLCFMATIHSDRYAIAKEIKDWCAERELRSFFYLFMHERVLYYFNKFKGKGVTAPMSEISFTKMSAAEIVKVFAASKVVLDIQHPKQTGLTMRTLETLGSGKKLITTNDKIKEYDFYDPGNIAVIDRSNPTEALNLDFFLDKPLQVQGKVLESYSIGGWLTDILRT
jgi:hypothetical protein